jgi:electron transfer flavoprotein alpha subunit
MVTPRLYVALGISGATQHVMGMAESEVIIAINLDPTAPIFELADLGVVGDLHLILPELLRLLDDRGEKWSVDANDKVEMTDG